MRWIAWAAPLVLAACFSESDVPGSGSAADDGSSGRGTGTTCDADAQCGETSTASASSGASATLGTAEGEAEAETTPAETSSDGSSSASSTPTGTTAQGDDSSSDGGSCVAAACSECVQCTFSEACKEEYDACLADPGCGDALNCTQGCLELPVEQLPKCVAMCGCTGGDPQQVLVDCVESTCVDNGSCTQLPCGS